MRALFFFFLLFTVAAATAFPVASTSPSRLIWIRCAAEADCHKHPVCHLRCEGTVNGRQRASFRAGPVPRLRDGGAETWLRHQLERLPDDERDMLFGSGGAALEIFLEIEETNPNALLCPDAAKKMEPIQQDHGQVHGRVQGDRGRGQAEDGQQGS